MGYGMDEEDWGDAAFDDMARIGHEAMSRRFSKAVNSAVGATIHCPTCDYAFVKKVPAQKFCGRKRRGRSNCKDVYHNTMNPRGLAARDEIE